MNDERKEFIAKFGTPAHQNKLMSDREPFIRRMVARHGSDEQRDQMMDDESPSVRITIAEQGRDRHRDKLVRDSDYNVLRAVAEHGSDSHREQLVDHPNPNVQNSVARKATARQAGRMLDNPNLDSYAVDKIADQYATTHFDKLINHPKLEQDSFRNLAVGAVGKPDRMEKMMNHKHISDDSLRDIADMATYDQQGDLYHKLLKHPAAHTQTKNVIARYGNESHREALAKSRNTAPATLNTLAHYGDNTTRDHILDHHNVEFGSALSTIEHHPDATPEQKQRVKHIRDITSKSVGGIRYKY